MSARQFYIVLALSVIAMKMQKLPSLVSGQLGKDAWVLFGVYGLINLIGILFVFFIFKHIDLKTVLKPSKNIFFNISCLKFVFDFYFFGLFSSFGF